MNTASLAQDLLSAYGRIAGLPDLKFEPHGCARLLFDGTIAVDLEIDEDAGCVQVYGVLGPVPDLGREGVYRALLEANMFGTQTRGATLSIDPVQHEVLLSRRVDVAVMTSGQAFGDLLNEFAGTLDQWRTRLQAGELTAPASVAAGDDLPLMSRSSGGVGIGMRA